MTERRLTTRDLASGRGDGGEGDTAEASAPAGQTPPGASPEAADPSRQGLRNELPTEGATGADDVEPSDQRESLLPSDQTERFTARWREIQTDFVDRPRDSVEQADALVADLMQRLAASFSNERERLEKQWDGGDDVSTEDLRLALTRYRSFFDRLLSA